ncbi:hypothetical protein SH501x_001375 [Pirellulaceae bacterium SH501]
MEHNRFVIFDDELIRTGKVRDMTYLAQIGKVTQARISQILSLTMLAPDYPKAS